jgi:hypothetical protein
MSTAQWAVDGRAPSAHSPTQSPTSRPLAQFAQSPIHPAAHPVDDSAIAHRAGHPGSKGPRGRSERTRERYQRSAITPHKAPGPGGRATLLRCQPTGAAQGEGTEHAQPV